MNQLQTTVIRERITPISHHYVMGFDVTAWLQDHPAVLSELECAASETEVIKTIERHLKPHLEYLAQNDGEIIFPDIEREGK